MYIYEWVLDWEGQRERDGLLSLTRLLSVHKTFTYEQPRRRLDIQAFLGMQAKQSCFPNAFLLDLIQNLFIHSTSIYLVLTVQ